MPLPHNDGIKVPSLNTSTARPSTAPGSSTPLRSHFDTPGETGPESSQTNSTDNRGSHQHFVLTDFVAFHYLETDPGTKVVTRHAQLKGYQCYVVEQWATSRSVPTFNITTHTGDPSHTLTVGVLSVPTDETTWTPKLRVYFKDLNQYNAKRQSTPLGILMVTNLAGFLPSLTLIQVPTGDIRSCRTLFYVNENLKRLGCSGRLGLSITTPAPSTVAKFYQLYHTSDKHDVELSVIELVRLCQLALVLFDTLELDYADGLLCDFTERAISDWWRVIGTSYYHVQPQDGILGPTTVAGLLGLLMGARNRLHTIGLSISKDPFDAESMKRAVGAFQKSNKLTRTRRLDHRTIEALWQATRKHVEHGGWGVSRMVKSTVAELSGKGGEMVLDAVGRRDRAGIADVETCDFERFLHLLYGDRPKWLWQGKSLKKPRDIVAAALGSHEVSEAQKSDPKSTIGDTKALAGADSTVDDSGSARPAVKQSNEGKSGIDRLRGVVGLGGHLHRQKSSRDDTAPSSPHTPTREDSVKWTDSLEQKTPSSQVEIHPSPGPVVSEERQEPTAASQATFTSIAKTNSRLIRRTSSSSTRQQNLPVLSRDSLPVSNFSGDRRRSLESNNRSSYIHLVDTNVTAPTIVEARSDLAHAESVYNDLDPTGIMPDVIPKEEVSQSLLRRTMSLAGVAGTKLEACLGDRHARHLSFSIAEDSVLTWTPVEDDEDGNAWSPQADDYKFKLAKEEFRAQESKRLGNSLALINTSTAPWVEHQLDALNSLSQKFEQSEGTFDELHQPRAERVQALQASSEAMFHEQRERLQEGVKGIEMLVAKLDYEINGLRGRIEDVHAGVQDYDKGVQRVERRIKDLELERANSRGRWGCSVM